MILYVKKGGVYRPAPLGLQARIGLAGYWNVVCRRPDGTIRWTDGWKNLVVTEGLNHILDVEFHGTTQVTTWYIGLLASSPSPAAGWTATEIAANDFVNYDEATLQEFEENAASSGSIDNVGNEAVFTISADSSTIGGAFLISTSAKATPAGVLYAAGAFSGGNKSADDDDTLTVTATFTAADDGV